MLYRSELVAMLLQAGADPAPDSRRGLTPMETALYHGSVAAAELLAEGTISPLALWSAAALGRLDVMETMVDGDGYPLPAAAANRPSLPDVGWPPAPPPDDDRQTILDEALAYAAINGRDAAIEWLLDHGGDVDGRPYLNVTPLHFVVQFRRASTVQLLLARGADPEIRDDIRRGTPLGWAAYQGRNEIARLLDPARTETITDTGLAYRPGEPSLSGSRASSTSTSAAPAPFGYQSSRPAPRFTPSSNGSPRRRSPSTRSCWSWLAGELRPRSTDGLVASACCSVGLCRHAGMATAVDTASVTPLSSSRVPPS